MIRDCANQLADVLTDNFFKLLFLSYCLTAWYRNSTDEDRNQNFLEIIVFLLPTLDYIFQTRNPRKADPILKDDTHPQNNSSPFCHLGGATDPSKPAAPGWRTALPPGPSLKSTWWTPPPICADRIAASIAVGEYWESYTVLWTCASSYYLYCYWKIFAKLFLQVLFFYILWHTYSLMLNVSAFFLSLSGWECRGKCECTVNICWCLFRWEGRYKMKEKQQLPNAVGSG